MGKYKNAVHYRDGLFSEVYQASAPNLTVNSIPPSSAVALKVTTPLAMTPPHDSEREARVLLEAKSAHVIELLETFHQAGGRLVLVFPFMQYDLDARMRQQKLSPTEAKACLRDLFSALAHLHSLGIIHRDVKPSNILLKSASGPAYLADFGIAWSPRDPASEPADAKITDVGTTSYRPPELLFGNAAYDRSLDLWAAGCVVAEVVHPNHKPLFDAGELGSDLALLHSIFRSLGTPNLQVWPVRAHSTWTPAEPRMLIQHAGSGAVP